MQTNISDLPTTTSLDTTQTMNMQIKNTWKQNSNLASSRNVTIIVVSFISFFSPSSDLLSTLPADLNGKSGVHSGLQTFEGAGEKTRVSFYSFPILLPSQEEEDTFRRYQKAKGWAVCPPRTAIAPATRSQADKEESWASGTSLAGEMWARTWRPQRNGQPFKAQKTTEFIFLSLKIQKQDGIQFPITAQGSHAASVTSDAVFQAGGHCRRAQQHQMEFKALLSNVIHSLFPGGEKKQKRSSKENTLTIWHSWS